MTNDTLANAGFDLGGLNGHALTRSHIFVLAACALGLGFDFAEIAIGGMLSALFSAPPSAVGKTELSWLLAAVYIGAVIGALVAGWLADKHGRRLVMLATVLMIVVTSVLAALSPNLWFLIVARGLSGLALGAFPPLVATYLADVLPASRRGFAIMTIVAIGSLFPPALVFLVRVLTPMQPLGIESWRWAFIVCAIGAAICLVMISRMPESPRWLASKGRLAEARRAQAVFGLPAEELPAGIVRGQGHGSTEIPRDTRGFVRRIGFMLSIFFMVPWSAVGFPVLTGAVLIQKGINVKDSLLYVGVSFLGPIIGSIVAGLFIDKIERKVTLILCAVSMAALCLAFGATNVPVWLMTTGLCFNMVSTVFQSVLVIYAAEVFSTAERARATSWSWASRGAGSVLAPLALLPLLQSHGDQTMFVIMAATLGLTVVALAVFGERGAACRPIG